MLVKITELRNLMEKVLSSKYYSKNEAKQITDVLLYAELGGKSTHGLVKLLAEPIQDVKPKYATKTLKETKLSALLDGGGAAGILVSRLAVKKAIEKCRKNGFGIVGTRNTFSSSGAIVFYAEEIAKNGFIGMVTTASPAIVAAEGGIEPILGTNPIAFGLPTEKEPLVLDMATAVVPYAALVKAQKLGKKIPAGIALDKFGNPTVEPTEAMQGALLAFGGHKGFGLSLVIEALSGPLVGSSYCFPIGKGDWGNLFIAIDPNLLAGRKEFEKNVSLMIKKVKESKKAHGVMEILVPGEKSQRSRFEAKKKGVVEIDDKLFNALLELAKS